MNKPPISEKPTPEEIAAWGEYLRQSEHIRDLYHLKGRQGAFEGSFVPLDPTDGEKDGEGFFASDQGAGAEAILGLDETRAKSLARARAILSRTGKRNAPALKSAYRLLLRFGGDREAAVKWLMKTRGIKFKIAHKIYMRGLAGLLAVFGLPSTDEIARQNAARAQAAQAWNERQIAAFKASGRA